MSRAFAARYLTRLINGSSTPQCTSSLQKTQRCRLSHLRGTEQVCTVERYRKYICDGQTSAEVDTLYQRTMTVAHNTRTARSRWSSDPCTLGKEVEGSFQTSLAVCHVHFCYCSICSLVPGTLPVPLPARAAHGRALFGHGPTNVDGAGSGLLGGSEL